MTDLTNQTETEQTLEPTTHESWVNAIQAPEEVTAFLKEFQTPEDLVRGYTELKAQVTVPDAYTFEDPDFQENDVALLSAMAKEAGLNQTQAAKLAAVAKVNAAQMMQQKVQEINKQYEDTLSMVQKQYGTRTPDVLQKANNVIEKFGGQEFREYLKATQLDNHPAVVKMFINIAEALQEDPHAGLGVGSRSAAAPEIKDPTIELRAALSDPQFRDALRRGDQVALDKMAGLKRLAEMASTSKR